MTHSGRWAAAALAVAVLTSCGGSSDSQAPTRSRTPTVPAVAQDLELAKKALVTPADLGTPWVEPKKVNNAGGKEGEACKGQPSAKSISKPRASQRVDMTDGTKKGAAIGSFEVRTLEPGGDKAWRDAFVAETKGCATATSPDGTFTTWDIVGAPTVPGSDDVVARIERVYADKSRSKLIYVRHTYEARSGRVISYLSYAYIQPASDPTGGDLTKSVGLLIHQVAKARATFGL